MRWGNDSINDTLRLRCTVQEKTPRMLLLPNPRNGRLLRAPPLLLLAAVLLCSVPGGTGLPGRASLLADLDEEIDFLQSIMEKQTVTEIKPAESPDVQRSRTDASKHKQKSPSDKTNTTAPLPSTTTPQPGATVVAGGRAGPLAVRKPNNDKIIIIVISVCVVVGSVAVIMASVCYVKLQKESRLAQKVDYPAYGGTGAPAATVNGTSLGDKTLAQSAQMYHYQHRKQQMLSVGNRKSEQNIVESEATSDEEEVGGDFTVYECPGLAPTGEMEVKNPLFDDSTLNYQGNHK